MLYIIYKKNTLVALMQRTARRRRTVNNVYHDEGIIHDGNYLLTQEV